MEPEAVSARTTDIKMTVHCSGRLQLEHTMPSKLELIIQYLNIINTCGNNNCDKRKITKFTHNKNNVTLEKKNFYL